jgi:hypothetical protein
MNIAKAIFARLGGKSDAKEDIFETRLRAMISPAVTGPRLRRIAPPVLFAFQSRSMA